jgi:hypothetical protein
VSIRKLCESNTRSGHQCHAYIIGRIDSWEGAFEPAHLLAANIGLTVVSTKKIIVTILNCCQLVGVGSELVRVVAKQGTLT